MDLLDHKWFFYPHWVFMTILLPLMVGATVLIILAESEQSYRFETPAVVFMAIGALTAGITIVLSIRTWLHRPWAQKHRLRVVR